MNRPSWEEYFLQLALLVSNRSTCHMEKQGAILVREKRVLTTGYNGAPSGMDNCLKLGCLRKEYNLVGDEKQEICRGLHAPQNAIIQAAVFGVSIKGATLFTTRFPCVICTKMLTNAEISDIIICGEPAFPESSTEAGKFAREMLEASPITVRFIPLESEVRK
ncbi:cytidine/deoxycytidylate deaminase family protein [bacterium]|nr:cytidine/deoxycytidylate deaminase family protein [bacterium]